MSETVALLREKDVDFDLLAAARPLAEVLAYSVTDMLQLLSRNSGILWRNLSQPIAEEAQARLALEGIAVTIIPSSTIVEPPDVCEANVLRIFDETLEFASDEQSGLIPWHELIWMNLAKTQNVVNESYEDFDTGHEERILRPMSSKRLTTTWRPHLDLISYEPWLFLRIFCEGFRFAETGLVVHANGWQNLVALSIAIASHSSDVAMGAGMRWFTSAKSPEEYRATSSEHEDHYICWELTRLFRQSDE